MFTGEFAHKAYMLFYRCVDSEMMEQILKNHEHVQELCHDYEQRIKATSQGMGICRVRFLSHDIRYGTRYTNFSSYY